MMIAPGRGAKLEKPIFSFAKAGFPLQRLTVAARCGTEFLA